MSTPGKPFQPFVSENAQMRELTVRALLLGLVMTVVLGAANAYLGLRAGITVAATYPAAVISMAAMRAWKGSLLEENISRTSGSIGEGVASGAIFTIPAFLISRAWPSFSFADAYWKSTVLILVGSVLGVLFISLVRRVMVEDPELPFPESIAASEIHKAGQRGAEAARYLFWNIGVGGVVFLLGRSGSLRGGRRVSVRHRPARGHPASPGYRRLIEPAADRRYFHLRRAQREPSVLRCWLRHRFASRLACNSSGGVLAWGLMVPLSYLFPRPPAAPFSRQELRTSHGVDWRASVWRYIVRPIAVGGMLVGAAYTLFRMKDSLLTGMSRAIGDLRQTAEQTAALSRTERYMSSKVVFTLIGVVFAVMIALYVYFSGGFVSWLRRGAYDADPRVFLRYGFGQFVRPDRIVEQSGLGTDAFDSYHCGVVDGCSGRFGRPAV